MDATSELRGGVKGEKGKKKKGAGKERAEMKREQDKKRLKEGGGRNGECRKFSGAETPNFCPSSLNHLQGASCSMIQSVTTDWVDQLAQLNPLNWPSKLY